MSSKTQLSRAEIAAVMRLTPARIDQLRRDGVLPYDGAMRATLEAAVAYFRDRCDLAAARRENLMKKTELLNAAIATANKTAIPVGEVGAAMDNLVLMARSKFLRIGNKLASRIAYLKNEAEIEAAIQNEVEEILSALARPIDFDGDKLTAKPV